jgi:hypothetical protein
VDKGITDANNMGAAMAPAAYETLSAIFRETGTAPRGLRPDPHRRPGGTGPRHRAATSSAGTASIWGPTTRTAECCSTTGSAGHARRRIRLRLLGGGAVRLLLRGMREGRNGGGCFWPPPGRCSPPPPAFRGSPSPASATLFVSRRKNRIPDGENSIRDQKGKSYAISQRISLRRHFLRHRADFD